MRRAGPGSDSVPGPLAPGHSDHAPMLTTQGCLVQCKMDHFLPSFARLFCKENFEQEQPLEVCVAPLTRSDQTGHGTIVQLPQNVTRGQNGQMRPEREI